MKKTQIVLLVLLFSMLTACSCTTLDNEQLANTGGISSVGQLQMPEAMKDIVEHPNVQWMAGILVMLDNAEMIHGISQDRFEVYSNPGNIIRATITVQNGLDQSQRFDLMVFEDGIPVAFEVDGKTHQTYPLVLTNQQSSINLEFKNEFPQNMGRLDFVLSFAESPRADSHLLTYSMWINTDEEPLNTSLLTKTVEQRLGLQDSYSGGAYNSWFWEEGIIPAETDNIGPRAISVQNGETILLEAIAAKPGTYRTVLVADGIPIIFESAGNQYSYIDWESTGTNMLQLPITFSKLPSTGSIYTITTPLTTDDLAQSILASGKVELIASVEE